MAQVVLWDLYDGRPAGAIVDIPGPVHALAFSRDGRRLAVGAGLPARSGVVRVYSVPDGTLIHDFAGPRRRRFRPGIPARRRTARLGLVRPDGPALEPRPGPARRRVPRPFRFRLLASPTRRDGRALLTGGKDRTIKRINVRTLKEERTYSGHDEDVLAVAVHPDGKRFVSAGNEPQLRWWSVRGRQAAGAAGRAFRAGAAARLQRRRPAADLGRRRPLGPALGWKDGRADPPARRPGRVAIRRRDLRRRPAGRGRRLGRPGPALGRRHRAACS